MPCITVSNLIQYYCILIQSYLIKMLHCYLLISSTFQGTNNGIIQITSLSTNYLATDIVIKKNMEYGKK